MIHSIRNNKNVQGASVDSIILTLVKIVTAALGLITTKLLSTQFSLKDYGTYSQALLLVSTTTSITILGLTDATNYFYNASDNIAKKQRYISTIFGIQYFVGILAGIIICILSTPIVHYFHNDQLYKLIYIAAWMPVFQNLIPMLQVLFVSIGKAKLIAVRNFIVSLARLIFVAIACFLTKNIQTIFVLILILDILQTIYFLSYFNKNKFRIAIRYFDKKLVKPILSFSIPMAVFVFTNSLSRDLDKYVIGYFADTETLAIYSNAAKVLPFDMLTASFLTVLVPIVTRQIRSENYNDALRSFKEYLRLGYLTTWILVGGAIIDAKELMLILYDKRYLPGLSVFIVYLLVDMTRFANTSMILSAKGKTKILMKWSIISLILNFVLNIFAYKGLGIIGPALTTLILTILLIIIYLHISARELKSTFIKLFNWNEICLVIFEIVALSAVVFHLKRIIYKWIDSDIIVFIITYALFTGTMLLVNKKRILECLKNINQLK